MLTDKLRARIAETNPTSADKITNMLSEMGKGRILKLLQSQETLEKQVAVAEKIIDTLL